jgi:serine/threonine-protein kinase
MGCVHYELLTGRKAFPGNTAVEAMAAVIGREPDWSLLPLGSPVELLKPCLQKDPKQRLRHIGDSMLVAALASSVSQTSAAAGSAVSAGRPWGWIVAVVLAATLVAGIGWYRAARLVPRPLQRFSAELGADVTLPTAYGSSVILSPDGSRLAFVGIAADAKAHLYTRLLDQPRAAQLSGTDGARDPFFSPDGEWIGFFAHGKLKKVSVQGGAALPWAKLPTTRVEVGEKMARLSLVWN